MLYRSHTGGEQNFRGENQTEPKKGWEIVRSIETANS